MHLNGGVFVTSVAPTTPDATDVTAGTLRPRNALRINDERVSNGSDDGGKAKARTWITWQQRYRQYAQ
jgi:hypothetical protein